MHEYMTTHHDRKITYFLITLVSGGLGTLIAYFIDKLEMFGVLVAAPSGMLVFTLTFLLFDKFIWNLPILYKWGIVKIPNLEGVWDTIITTADPAAPEVKAKAIIHQTYSKIKIRIETDKSHSVSQMAILEMTDPTCFNLRYEYEAQYKRDENSNILRHYGVSCFSLKSNNHDFSSEQSATYYTEQGRDTHGEILIKKAS